MSTRLYSWTRLLVAVLFVFGFGFSAAAQNPVPLVNLPLVPASAAPGGAQFTLTVNGSGFVANATVNWNSTALATTFVSASRLTAVVPAALISSAGTASVTVTNPSTAAPSNAIYFSVAAQYTPVAFSQAPQSPYNLGSAPNEPMDVNEPLAMAEGDFNGDGKVDLVVTSENAVVSGYNVVVYPGNGDGTFGAPVSTAVTGTNGGSIGVGDFNGDGKMDLAIGNYESNSVLILLGKGDGTFTAARMLTVGNNPTAVTVADLNHDGKLDLVVPDFADKNAFVFLGNGDGTFTAASGSPFNVPENPTDVVAGDFNNDGKLDLAFSTVASNTVAIMLGNGDGTFQAPSSIVAAAANNLAAADVNGDGKLDLVVPYEANGTLAVLLGNGDGTFTAVSSCCGTIIPTSRTYGFVLGDFNNDGKLDAAISLALDGTPGLLTVLPGNGDGTFNSTNESIQVSPGPFDLVAGDFNGDGKMDLATDSNPYSSVSVVLQQNPAGPAPDFALSVTAASQTVSPGGSATYDVQLSSVNGFLGLVALSCSGAPALSTCMINATPLLQYDAQTSYPNLVVSTTAPTTKARLIPMAGPFGSGSGGSGLAGSGSSSAPRGLLTSFAAILAIVFLTMWAALKNRPVRARVFAVAQVAVIGFCFVLMASCGSGSGSGNGNGGGGTTIPGTAPGSYTVTVTATSPATASSPAITHSIPVTLIVQ